MNSCHDLVKFLTICGEVAQVGLTLGEGAFGVVSVRGSAAFGTISDIMAGELVIQWCLMVV